jgi:8-oxo-dGTP diphosphatase
MRSWLRGLGARLLRTPQVSVGAVVVHEGQLLLVKRKRPPGAGLWSLPGGRVRWGEKAREALVREVAEETGLVIEPENLVGIGELIGDRYHFLVLNYRGRVVASRSPTPGSDAAAAALVELRSVPSLPLVPSVRAFLIDAGILPATEG